MCDLDALVPNKKSDYILFRVYTVSYDKKQLYLIQPRKTYYSKRGLVKTMQGGLEVSKSSISGAHSVIAGTHLWRYMYINTFSSSPLLAHKIFKLQPLDIRPERVWGGG